MTYWQLFAYFLRLGATGFGGPAALVERMRRDLVERRRCLSADEYETGLAIAAASPGPLAFQLAVFCGYVRKGLAGALSVAVAFALTPFAIVVVVAALYTQYSRSAVLTGIFHGVGPVVVALVVRACWHLGWKTLGSRPLAWAVAIVVCVTSLFLGREPTLLILLAGVAGVLVFATAPSAAPPPTAAPRPPLEAAALVPLASLTSASAGSWPLFSFFFKTGCFVFGSGLVIAPFLQSYVVNDFQWLTDQQFRDAIAVGLVSPGPVVITATFVGYVVDGFRGALAAAAGMFAPAIVFTVILAPLIARFGNHARVRGFIRGVTIAVVGVLAATAPLIASSAVTDVMTALIFLVGLGVLATKRAPEPLVVAAGALAGVIVQVVSPAGPALP
jgi:chromate transporter